MGFGISEISGISEFLLLGREMGCEVSVMGKIRQSTPMNS